MTFTYHFANYWFLFQAKHAEGGNSAWGINGETGEIANMKDLGIWDCYSVKAQTLKTAIEVNSYTF